MRFRVIGTAASLLAVPGASFALGLGEIHLRSSLNAPLNAEIELTASAEELTSLRAQIRHARFLQSLWTGLSGIHCRYPGPHGTPDGWTQHHPSDLRVTHDGALCHAAGGGLRGKRAVSSANIRCCSTRRLLHPWRLRRQRQLPRLLPVLVIAALPSCVSLLQLLFLRPQPHHPFRLHNVICWRRSCGTSWRVRGSWW